MNVNKLLLYIGVRVNSQDKLYHVYSIIGKPEDKPEPDDSDNQLWYSKKLYPCSPGTIFSIDIDRKEDGANTAHINTAKYTCRHSDYEYEKHLQGLSMASSSTFRMKKEVKTITSENKLDDMLTTLNKTYRALSNVQRSQFLANIVYRITKSN